MMPAMIHSSRFKDDEDAIADAVARRGDDADYRASCRLLDLRARGRARHSRRLNYAACRRRRAADFLSYFFHCHTARATAMAGA